MATSAHPDRNLFNNGTSPPVDLSGVDGLENTDGATDQGAGGRSRRLIARAGDLRRSTVIPELVAERLVRSLLQRLRSDRISVVDAAGGQPTEVYGPGPTLVAGAADLWPTVVINDARAWSAVIGEGSAGLGRGYIEGWWDSDDPVAVVQVIARNIDGLDELRNRWSTATAWFTNRFRRILPSPDRSTNRDDIATHYDLGNEFFELFLDDTLTYSSAVFTSPQVPLAEASTHKYDRLLAKLGVDGSHRLLEIGTGWGGFALRAGEKTGCSVTTTTISEAQLQRATDRVAAAVDAERIEADSVTLLDKHWRDLDGRFDRLVSIEMIEAVDWRHYDEFFAAIEDRLEPDGLVGLQAICLPDRRYERAKNTEDFIRRFVFPGGFLPSLGAIGSSVARATRLQLLDVEDLSAHYAETLRRWRVRFDDRLDDVRALGLDDRFQRLWRFYLAYCEAGFRERHCTVNQIVLAGPQWRPDGLALRPL